MIAALEWPLALEQQLRDEALSASPRECCGLLEGDALKGEASRVLRVLALHPAANIANEPDRFEIDPAAQIALLCRLRGSGRAIIGCYHSHPNGRAEPSQRDRDGAVEPDFLWLICAVEMNKTSTRIGAFVSTGHSFSQVPIAAISGSAGEDGLITSGHRRPRAPGVFA